MKPTLLAALVLVSCGPHDAPEIKRDPERQRREIEPASGQVRPLPPHAIRADGVGPYRLRASLAELLEQLPSGPRIATLDIPGVVHRSVLRAEEDAILIGGEPLGKASFIAVIGGEIARTESGIHVGSTREELVHALGPPETGSDHARDPHVVAPTGLRNARVVLDSDRITAIVVLAEPETPRAVTAKDPVEGPCARPTPDPEANRFGACLGAGETVAIEGDDLVVHAGESDRVLARTRVSGLLFAAALRNPNDGRDELVAISHTEDAQQRTWSLVAFRLEGAHLVRTLELTPLYQLTTASARWVGAELRDLDLFLELTARQDAIEVGGLLTTRNGAKLRDVVLISPVSVTRRRAKSAPIEAGDAGASDPAAVGTEPTKSGRHPHE